MISRPSGFWSGILRSQSTVVRALRFVYAEEPEIPNMDRAEHKKLPTRVEIALDYITGEIAKGNLMPGDKLPNEKELAVNPRHQSHANPRSDEDTRGVRPR